MARDNEIAPAPSAVLAVDEINEKVEDEKLEISPAGKEEEVAADELKAGREVDPDLRAKLVSQYGRKAEEDGIAPSADITLILEKILTMTEERAMEILLDAVQIHADDPNFPSLTMEKITMLTRGYKAADMEYGDWEFELKTQAAMIYYHSPYPEVRSVTDPYDDPSIPVETIRAYFLGMIFMAGSTALNTFFSPRQPGISLSSLVLQGILAPCGQFLAKVLPDWGFTVFGRRVSLNPGPWTFKEQVFATIMFSIANGAGGTYYTYLVQMLPQYLGQTWVNYGYELLLALYAQMAGFGFAGFLRRFLIYPSSMIWPQVLPTLALNRVLIKPEKKGEVVNGWRITRYKVFLIAFAAMFVWFWIPNNFFTALHAFNWMTWISPQNINLAIVTGFYGGMGFNPWATFDWNVAGSGALVTPWFSAIQQYAGRFWSGLVMLWMYYTNYKWAGYMPINSNETFDRFGKEYNISNVMGDDGYVNVEAYKKYGPPYYASNNVMGQGNLPAYYFMTLTYMFIRYWSLIQSAAKQMWKAVRQRTSLADNDDAHSRMMAEYKEVPDWWYLCILLGSLACGIAAISAFPTHTPVWALIVTMIIGCLWLIPSTMVQAIANTGISLDILFKILSGVWFPGNPMALLILESICPQFDAQTESYMAQQKLAHYAKIPPRAIFRAMMLAVFLNCLIFIGVLNWMVNSYNDGTLCTWSNPEHFVCLTAVQDFTSAVMYGIFGVRNMYTLYPQIPWAMLIGAFAGVFFALTQKYGKQWVDKCRYSWEPEKVARWNKWVFRPFDWFYWFNPVVFYTGVCDTWTGGGNLSFHTNYVYISYIFMYHIKRHYGGWWEKYNFILEAGFDIGTAVSGTIQTLAFAFSGKSVPKWWGNTVSTAGIDYTMYNQKAALLPIPEKGYFGLDPNQFPVKYPKDLLDGTRGVRNST